MSTIANDLKDAIFSLPIIDTHTHMRPYDSMPQPMTALELFNRSGNLRQLWVSSGALSRIEHRQGKCFEDWPALSAALDKVKTTAFYRMHLNGLKSLFSLEFDELDERVMNALSEKLAEAYRDPGWYRTVLKDKCGMEMTLQDNRMAPMDRALFTPVARFDGYTWFGRRVWREPVVEKHGEEKTSTVRGLVECMKADFDEAIKAGAVAIKNNSTWCRKLEYPDVDESVAERALIAALAAENVDIEATNTLGNYITNRLCELCADYSIPLQLHTGAAGGTDHWIDYGNPIHLNGLMLQHTTTKFVLFHAGGPFFTTCRDLAVQFPNVYLDLCGVLGVETIRLILDLWIEQVPHTKIMWGTDVNVIEEAYSTVLNFRTVLTRFLADRVESGYLSRRSAIEFAKAVLADNARGILRLPWHLGAGGLAAPKCSSLCG